MNLTITNNKAACTIAQTAFGNMIEYFYYFDCLLDRERVIGRRSQLYQVQYGEDKEAKADAYHWYYHDRMQYRHSLVLRIQKNQQRAISPQTAE